jgi:outer membrane protein W
MRTRLIATLPLLAALALAPRPALAQSNAGWRLRVWGGAVGRYVLNDNDTFDAAGYGTVGLKVDGSAPGFGADAEYKLARWIGLDAAIGYSNLTVDYTTTTSPGTVTTQGFAIVPIMLSLNIHLISTSSVDFWVGPQLAYLNYPTSTAFTPASGPTYTYMADNEFSKKGFSAGLDVGLNKRVLLNLAVRWNDADGDSNDHLTIDPTFVTIGIGFRP